MPPTVSTVAIVLLSGGKSVAATTLTRRLSSPGVQATELSVAKGGLAATFYAQASSSHRPAVLQLSGSGGGHASTGGALLASHGYPTLSLGYFGEPGLPPYLQNIPLEYFQKALNWWQPSRLSIQGESR